SCSTSIGRSTTCRRSMTCTRGLGRSSAGRSTLSMRPSSLAWGRLTGQPPHCQGPFVVFDNPLDGFAFFHLQGLRQRRRTNQIELTLNASALDHLHLGLTTHGCLPRLNWNWRHSIIAITLVKN